MKQKFLPIFLVLSAFFLFGCGLTNLFTGDNNTPPNAPQEEATTPIQPTNTSPAQPTTEPTSETSQNSETQPTATVFAESDSACYHPFFPIVEGASWTYDDDFDSGYTITVEETAQDTFMMTQEMENEDTIFTAEWYCSEDGLLRGTFGQMDILSQATGEESPEFAFETMEWEGETLPAPELMEPGYTWTSEYRLQAELNIEGFSGTAEVEVSIDHEIAAIEEVTVPAGTFPEAYRVDSAGEIEFAMFLGETSSPINGIDFNFRTWYVEGLGMVKSADEFSEFSSTTELISSSLLE